MTDSVSTILVMGPRGAGKSNFIKLLAGPIKLQPNGVPTDRLRTISVSPYFTGGDTIKLVKFPGFDESDTDLTDAKLFIGIATFLGSCSRRGERIRSIVYLHPITPADRSKVADVDRNITMLQRIAPGAMRNIVVVTTGWDEIPETDDEMGEPNLPGGLTRLGLGKPLQHDGTKVSALLILNNATRKTPILLELDGIPRRTDAGKELIHRIAALIKSKQEREDKLFEEIEKEENKDKVKQLEGDQRRLADALTCLRNDRMELGAAINWEQAAEDNEALERVIKEQHDSATKDWKVEYDKLLKKSKAKVVEYDKLAVEHNKIVAKYDSLLKEKNALVDTHLKPFSVPIRAICDYAGNGAIMSFKTGDLLHTTAQETGDFWRVRNSAGRTGVAAGSSFEKLDHQSPAAGSQGYQPGTSAAYKVFSAFGF